MWSFVRDSVLWTWASHNIRHTDGAVTNIVLPKCKPWCGGCIGNGDVGYLIKERSYFIRSNGGYGNRVRV
jgi:hypothetical protein